MRDRNHRPDRRHFGRLTVGALAVGLLTLSASCQEVKEPTTTLTQAQWEEVKSNILEAPPQKVQHEVGARFGDKIELIGVDIEPDKVKPGREFTVTWYWKALAEMDVNWQVFVHMDISGARPTRQGLDHHPVGDLYQTTRWKKGQVIKDSQTVRLRNDFPGGEATFWVGFWNPATSKRLPVANPDDVKHDGDNRVNAATVTVDAPAAKAGKKAAADKKKKRPKMYMVRPLSGEVTIDGKLDEEVWEKAPRTAYFGGTRGGPGPGGANWAKLLYDDEFLYIALFGEDEDAWGKLTKRDSDTWTEEVFEVFIDPDGDARDYLELQVTPNNVVFDARFPVKLGTGEGTREEQIDAGRAWNSKMVTAVHVDGTVNDHKDKDKSWSVELKIPMSEIPGGAPKVGASWKVNFYRFEAPRDAAGNKTGQKAWAWSPPHGFFHNVENFGTLRFLGAPGARLAPNAPGGKIVVPSVKADPKGLIEAKRKELERKKAEAEAEADRPE